MHRRGVLAVIALAALIATLSGHTAPRRAAALIVTLAAVARALRARHEAQ